MTSPLSPNFCVPSTLVLLSIILTQFLFTLVANQTFPLMKNPLNLDIFSNKAERQPALRQSYYYLRTYFKKTLS